MRPVDVAIEATDGKARAAVLTTARGSIRTPCFMPVGTRGAVKHLTSVDLEDLGVEVMLANTYHLMLKPGAELIKSLGGLHQFMDWSGHVLTDSGGYQVFSLDSVVGEEGVEFKSIYDGSAHLLTPESAVDIQESLGADIQMVLDVCPALPATPEKIRDAVDTTARWAERARVAHTRVDQSLFGIVQGGVDADLRSESAERTVALDFDGYAIGGLSVGEPRGEMVTALEAATAALPINRARYLMGVGDPAGLVEGIALGVDLFDCVLPTRLARHGTVLTWDGRYNLRAARFTSDERPLDPKGPEISQRWSRAYLRHLLRVDEPTAKRVLTLHNLAWLLSFVEHARTAIIAGEFDAFRADTLGRWG